MTGCIFLDRDGVINAPAPPYQYITSIAAFRFLPGALDALAFLAKNTGRKIAIVTNQSPIGRGLATQEQVDDLHDWMERRIARHGGRIDEIYVCPHRPDEGCECRKPAPGLLLQAARDLGVDLAQSCLVGDTETDLRAAWAAGVSECYLVLSGQRIDRFPVDGRYLVVQDLAEAAGWIERRLAQEALDA